MTTPHAELLACPRCDKALEETGAAFHCKGCKVGFPLLAGVPWLFAEPSASMSEWRQRLDFLLAKLDQDRRRIKDSLASKDLLSLTRRRLETLAAAIEDHSRRLAALLEPLNTGLSRASYEMYLALRTRLPPDQGLMTYYPNMHRDWSWGGEENDAALRLLNPGLTQGGEGQRILVLGSGAGRLAYDVHEKYRPELTVALDFNPLFQLALARIAAGEALEFYEFPLAPRSAGDQAVLRTLAAPASARPGFVTVLADASRPPFRDSSFDTVVTPWLVDILPEDFRGVCARINRLLGRRGRWLNIGSLAFAQAGPELQYSREECAVLMQAAGFAAPVFEEARIPYMCSPASRHGRSETVVVWQVEKKKQAKRPSPHEALPEWLIQGTEPVPQLPAFRVQATTTRIHAALMGLVDGRRSVKDMAKILVAQRAMSEADAEPAIREFLTKMYHDSRRAQRL
jgi:ubiquinone/menaquinone biosynthesis C-methylase UbiE/uncharacterized protein YbaR (Trm112 family)